MTSGAELPAGDVARLMDDLTGIVARACAVIGTIAGGAVAHRLKPDRSPVSDADEASEKSILDDLARLVPGLPVVSEEMAGRAAPGDLGDSFAVVDPLDGTKEFLAGSDQYTVNLALVTRGMPVAGIVAAPARRLLWRGLVGRGAERLRLADGTATDPQPVRARPWPSADAVAVMSRSHLDAATEALLARFGPIARRPAGSAIKFCQLAEGAADVYPRLSTTCEWDVAAGQALLTAAGGIVSAPDGGALPFGRVALQFRVPAFIAWGDPAKAATFHV